MVQYIGTMKHVTVGAVSYRTSTGTRKLKNGFFRGSQTEEAPTLERLQALASMQVGMKSGFRRFMADLDLDPDLGYRFHTGGKSRIAFTRKNGIL
jgi:hypothetical protein